MLSSHTVMPPPHSNVPQSYTLESLQRSTEYNVSVVVKNSNGTGPGAAVQQSTPPGGGCVLSVHHVYCFMIIAHPIFLYPYE